mmetsp:Transcript_13083/g.49971  ORF Transcript_13083/g.49971 Transcript_13083/m.49971 type:complete len:280 (+) Transcript_13083:785-1624(+)
MARAQRAGTIRTGCSKRWRLRARASTIGVAHSPRQSCSLFECPLSSWRWQTERRVDPPAVHGRKASHRQPVPRRLHSRSHSLGHDEQRVAVLQAAAALQRTAWQLIPHSRCPVLLAPGELRAPQHFGSNARRCVSRALGVHNSRAVCHHLEANELVFLLLLFWQRRCSYSSCSCPQRVCLSAPQNGDRCWAGRQLGPPPQLAPGDHGKERQAARQRPNLKPGNRGSGRAVRVVRERASCAQSRCSSCTPLPLSRREEPGNRRRGPSHCKGQVAREDCLC